MAQGATRDLFTEAGLIYLHAHQVQGSFGAWAEGGGNVLSHLSCSKIRGVRREQRDGRGGWLSGAR